MNSLKNLIKQTEQKTISQECKETIEKFFFETSIRYEKTSVLDRIFKTDKWVRQQKLKQRNIAKNCREAVDIFYKYCMSAIEAEESIGLTIYEPKDDMNKWYKRFWRSITKQNYK